MGKEHIRRGREGIGMGQTDWMQVGRGWMGRDGEG